MCSPGGATGYCGTRAPSFGETLHDPIRSTGPAGTGKSWLQGFRRRTTPSSALTRRRPRPSMNRCGTGGHHRRISRACKVKVVVSGRGVGTEHADSGSLGDPGASQFADHLIPGPSFAGRFPGEACPAVPKGFQTLSKGIGDGERQHHRQWSTFRGQRR